MTRLVRARPPLDVLLLPLLAPGETLTVRELDYGRLLALEMWVLPDRHVAVLNVHLDFLASPVGIRDLAAHALDRLRAFLADQPPGLAGFLPVTWPSHPGLDGPTPAQAAVPADTAHILVEFAKANKREDFDWLARSAGVLEAQLEELWRGTLLRHRRPEVRPRAENAAEFAENVMELRPERWD